jgi:hypothetical protein
VTYRLTDETSAVLSFWDCPWFVILLMSWFSHLTISKTFLILYAPSLVAVGRFDMFRQYSSKGIVKEFRHPNSANILKQKASHADVVSAAFQVALALVTGLQVSLCACKDNQKANETVRGGALRLASLIDLGAISIT